MCAVHVFGAYLIDAAMRGRPKGGAAGENGSPWKSRGERGDWEKAARVLRVLVRTARECVRVDGVASSVGGKVLERAAECVVLMEGLGNAAPEDVDVMARLRTEYLAARVVTVPPLCAWKLSC